VAYEIVVMGLLAWIAVALAFYAMLWQALVCWAAFAVAGADVLVTLRRIREAGWPRWRVR
jgi:hypothetical protein